MGDVQLCSGQSNMEWQLDLTAGFEEELAVWPIRTSDCFRWAIRSPSREQGENINDLGREFAKRPVHSRAWVTISWGIGAETGVPVGLIAAVGRYRHRGLDQLVDDAAVGLSATASGKSFVDAYASVRFCGVPACARRRHPRERWYDPRLPRGSGLGMKCRKVVWLE